MAIGFFQKTKLATKKIWVFVGGLRHGRHKVENNEKIKKKFRRTNKKYFSRK